MDNLASLHDRINQAIADKVIGKILTGEARNHFKHGWKTECGCSICAYRRDYAARQNMRNALNGHRTMGGGWWDARYHRKELNRAFKRKVLEGMTA
jgi:hypothetical protein